MKYFLTIICMTFCLFVLSGCDEDYSTDDSSYSDTTSDLQSQINELESKVSTLEECTADFNRRMDDINSEANLNAWSDYDSMGNALDNIDSTSASYYTSLECK